MNIYREYNRIKMTSVTPTPGPEDNQHRLPQAPSSRGMKARPPNFMDQETTTKGGTRRSKW